MRFSRKLVVLSASLAFLAAISAGCGTHVGVRTGGSVMINQTFTDAPLGEVLIAIEKASSGMGVATDPSVDLNKNITVRLEEMSLDQAVAAVAKAAGYQWAYDPNLHEKTELRGQYWPYPMFLIAEEIDRSLFPASEEEAQLAASAPEEDVTGTTAPPTEASPSPSQQQEEEAQALYEKAEALYSDGNYLAAKQAYTELKAREQFLTSRQGRNVHKRLNDIDETLRKMKAKEEEEAERRIEEARRQYWLERFQNGEKLYEAGNYEAAKATLEDVRSADISLGWSVNRKISSYLGQIDKKLAEEKQQREIRNQLALGIQQYEAGNYRSAVELFSQVEKSKAAGWTLKASAREHMEKAEARLQMESQRDLLIARLDEIEPLLEAQRYEDALTIIREIASAVISLGPDNDARLQEYEAIAQTRIAEEMQRIEAERMARIETQNLLEQASSLYLTGDLEAARSAYAKVAAMSDRLEPYEIQIVRSRLSEIDAALAVEMAEARSELPHNDSESTASAAETPTTLTTPAPNSASAQPEPTPEAVRLALEKQKEAERLANQPKVNNVFFNTDIREAISDMAAQTGVNIITDASVEGWVTLSLDGVPLEKALSMMCLSGGFTWRDMGDYYLVGAATPESVNYALLSRTESIKTDLPASQVRNRLSEFFLPYTRVASDEDHVLIVTGPEAVVENVIDSINQIDSPRHQVRIEAVVTEISWAAEDDKGMNWMNTLMDLDAEGTMSFVEGAFPAYSSNVVGTIVAELSALAQTAEVDIKANPVVVTLEGEAAQIKIVEERYFVILTGNLNFPTSDLEVIESGVILNVTPTVTRSGDILMSIVPDVSDVTGTSGGREDLPLVTRRSVESKVKVSDGETVVIGGLLKHLSREIIRKVPILGDIPIINFAFRNKLTQDTDTELVVFITPRILRD